MTLQHHGQYSTTVDPNWPQNPFNTANGGFLSDPKQFFTDTTAKALTKRKYRYIVARWGYSPAVMAWELFNEVQFTDAAQNGQWANVAAWHWQISMAETLRLNLTVGDAGADTGTPRMDTTYGKDPAAIWAASCSLNT